MFSPYYAWARGRDAGDPLQFCSINVSLYGKGGKRWTMTERTALAVSQSTESFAVGPSALSWDGTRLTIDIDEVTVPIPSRVRGRVRVMPRAVTETRVTLDQDGDHSWWPIAPISDVEVEMTSPARHWRGHAYFDSNWGRVPLERSFTGWHWSRANLGGDAAIFYDVDRRGGPEPNLNVALRFDRTGARTIMTSPPAAALPGTFWGISRRTRNDDATPARVVSTLENAPFYARSLVETGIGGDRVQAMHESLDLDRFASPWVQMLLPFKMPRRKR